MTVKELIKTLEQVENKELDIVINDNYGIDTTEVSIAETTRYYFKTEPYGTVGKERKCIVFI